MYRTKVMCGKFLLCFLCAKLEHSALHFSSEFDLSRNLGGGRTMDDLGIVSGVEGVEHALRCKWYKK